MDQLVKKSTILKTSAGSTHDVLGGRKEWPKGIPCWTPSDDCVILSLQNYRRRKKKAQKNGQKHKYWEPNVALPPAFYLGYKYARIH